MYTKKEKICPAYVLKRNSNGEKQVILLMIPNEEKWYYLIVKKLSPWLRGITCKHHGGFCFLNCLPPFETEKNVDCIKRCVKIKIFVM